MYYSASAKHIYLCVDIMIQCSLHEQFSTFFTAELLNAPYTPAAPGYLFLLSTGAFHSSVKLLSE